MAKTKSTKETVKKAVVKTTPAKTAKIKIAAEKKAKEKTAAKTKKAAVKAKAASRGEVQAKARTVKSKTAAKPAPTAKTVKAAAIKKDKAVKPAVKARAPAKAKARAAAQDAKPAAPLKFMNLRKAYGEALVEAGKLNKDVVVLEADLGKSTMSIMFKEAFPDRYFEMGIAEANMTSTAAGFALAGKIPFTGTFAVFAAGRAYDQIRCSIAIPEANVKIIGSSCGLSDYGDGKTHQSVEDSNIIRAIPNMVVLNPVDAEEVKKMVPAIIKHKGPVYLRINRNDLPVFTSPKGEFKIGKIYPITEGPLAKASADAVIFATGVMVSKSVEAAGKLKAQGISVQVLNVSTLKPLNKKEVLKDAAGKKAVIVAEEAVRTGGLGQAIASFIIGEVKAKFESVAIDDEFGTSSLNYDELLTKFGLSSDHVYKAVIKALKAK
jgi:transketolase